VFDPIAPAVHPVLDTIASAFHPVFDPVTPAVHAVFGPVAPALNMPCQAVLAGLFGALCPIPETFSEPFPLAIVTRIDPIAPFIQAAINPVATSIEPMIYAITAPLESAVDPLPVEVFGHCNRRHKTKHHCQCHCYKFLHGVILLSVVVGLCYHFFSRRFNNRLVYRSGYFFACPGLISISHVAQMQLAARENTAILF
jgi:hypothetical protein